MKKFGSWTEQATSKFRSNGQEITLAPPASPSSSFTITLPNISAGDVLIGRSTSDQSANRIKNKHFDSTTNFFVDTTDTTKRAWIDTQLLSTATTVPLILPNQASMVAGSLPLVGTNTTQTLTNKSIDADSNIITNIDNADIKAGAAINASKIADGSVSNTEFQFLQNLLSAAVGVSDTQTLTNKTLTTPQVNEAVALTATSTELNQLDGVSVGGTALGDIITTDDVQTLSNKSLITPKIYDTAIDNTYNIVAAGDLVANRQIFLPILSADDTFVFQGASQSLTNKTIESSTIDADLNTITNIDNADIKAAAGIQFSKMQALTINRATEINGSGVVVASAITTTELNRLSGVTSNIQTQIDGKTNDVITTRGDLIVGNASAQESRLPLGAIGQVLSSDGTDAVWTTLAGTGDVTSGASLTDNYIVRGDGGAKGVQTSLVYIDDSGNLGVGTAAPGSLLEVKSAEAVNVDGQVVADFVGLTAAGTIGSGPKITFSDSGGLPGAAVGLYTHGAGATGLRFQTSYPTPVDAMVILEGGNVGIGTTTPDADLQIGTQTPTSTTAPKMLSLGGTYASNKPTDVGWTQDQIKLKLYDNNSTPHGFSVNTSDGIAYVTSNTSDHTFYSNGVELMRLDGTTGNVGIGTSAPANKLMVSDAADFPFSVHRQANGVNFGTNIALSLNNSLGDKHDYVRISGGIEDATAGAEDGRLIFFVSEAGNEFSEKMRITSAGNVGIGATIPEAKLTVYGDHDAAHGQLMVDGSGNNAGITLHHNSASASSRNWGLFTNFDLFGDLDFRVGSSQNGDPDTTVFRMSSDGNFTLRGGDVIGYESDLGAIAYQLLAGASSGLLQLMQGGTAVVQFAGAGGANYHYLNSGANFGIGTTTPSTTFEINRAASAATSASFPQLVLLSGSANYARAPSTFMTGAADGTNIIHILGQGQASNNSALFGYYHAATGSTSNKAWIGLYNTANQGLTINGSGQVGIGLGTTDPYASLHVAGDHNIRLNATTVTSGSSDYTVFQTMPGIELYGGGMNTTSKWTPAIKFGSNDSQLGYGVEGAFLAGIVGRAKQTYGAVGQGGMDMDFFATATNSSSDVPSARVMTLDANVGLYPATTAVYDLGTSSLEWRDLYLSGRISFDNGTNSLDAYESGTWSPTLTFLGGNGTATLTGVVARYIKIGDMVWVSFYGTINKGTGSGSIRITNLPYISNSQTTVVASFDATTTAFTGITAGQHPQGLVPGGGNYVFFSIYDPTAGNYTASLTNTNINTGNHIWTFTHTYYTGG